MQKITFLLFIFLGLMLCQLEAVGIRLLNDSHYPLRAVIIGANGAQLGEVQVAAQDMVSWYDSSSTRAKEGYTQGSVWSVTPMTVQWYCPEGDVYSVSHDVTTGALVQTTKGEGRKSCSKGNVEKTGQ